MIVDCIADLHGHYPDFEDGDLLIIAGDLTRRDLEGEFWQFNNWLACQPHSKKIVIAGNHDNYLYEDINHDENPFKKGGGEYLCDSGTEYKGFKIWGSPWTTTFEGINPKCKAFTVETEQELADKWTSIPDHIDILITHSPPFDILDELIEEGKHAGSTALGHVLMRVRPKLHVFGHIHEAYGSWRPYLEFLDLPGFPIFVNASHVNHVYRPINKPIRIEL